MPAGSKTRRGGVLEQARRLAKSGAYTSADAVLGALREIDPTIATSRWFSDFRFKAQLGILCELARRS